MLTAHRAVPLFRNPVPDPGIGNLTVHRLQIQHKTGCIVNGFTSAQLSLVIISEASPGDVSVGRFTQQTLRRREADQTLGAGCVKPKLTVLEQHRLALVARGRFKLNQAVQALYR